MSKVKVSESVSQSVTRSPIELLWTAKKIIKIKIKIKIKIDSDLVG